MASSVEIIIEGRIRRMCLCKLIGHGLMPLNRIGLLDGCTLLQWSTSVLRFDWRFEHSGWKKIPVDVNVSCDDEDKDGGEMLATYTI